jgi:hypothetical protein
MDVSLKISTAALIKHRFNVGELVFAIELAGDGADPGQTFAAEISRWHEFAATAQELGVETMPGGLKARLGERLAGRDIAVIAFRFDPGQTVN